MKPSFLMLGCALIIAFPFFLLGLVCSLLTTKVPPAAHLGMGAMTVAIAFLAACGLFIRDRSRHFACRRNVQRRFASREEVDDAEFAAELALKDYDLAVHLRRRLAQYFDIPAVKIRFSDELELMAFDAFMPWIYLFVMSEICQQCQIQNLGRFPKTKLKTVGDLLSEAKILLTENPSDGDQRE